LDPRTIVLGSGVTGLAAGGVCSSYYMRLGTAGILRKRPPDGEAYHFAVGGGHWIFGGNPTVIQFLGYQVGLETYQWRSKVYLPGEDLYVPYPLQNHLRALGSVRPALAPTPGDTAVDFAGVARR
jgi:hypothetical protein